MKKISTKENSTFFTAATIVELESLVEPVIGNRPEIYY
jgi:hypothetical protein